MDAFVQATLFPLFLLSLGRVFGLPTFFAHLGSSYQPKRRNHQTRCDPHTSAELLARQLIWGAKTPAAKNEAFNCVNADRAKWFEVWLNIGKWFDMPIELKENGMSTDAIMLEAEKSGLWDDMIKKYGLRDQPLSRLMPKTTIDSFMMIDWDQPYCVDKIRNAGFTETVDSSEMFCDLFQTLRDVKAIP